MRRAERRGFTLLELLVALALSGLVIAGARGVLEGLASYADRAATQSRQGDALANGERLARRIVRQVSLRAESHVSFDGSEHEARFGSWCDVAGGWREPCDVRVGVARLSGGANVVMHLSTGDSLIVRVGATTGRLVYLASAEDGGRWRGTWTESMTTPLAIGVISGTDTLLLRIGERR